MGEQLIPPWFRNLLIALLAIWLGYQLFDYGRDVQAKSCALDQTTAALSTSEQHRADEGATTAKRSEASDEHIQALKTLVDQRNAADLAAERLRRQLAETVRVAQRCAPGDPAAEQSRQAAAALGAVFAACQAEYRALGSEAAERYAAGTHAEQDYDALTNTSALGGRNGDH